MKTLKRIPQRPYNNAWEMAMNIHDNKVVPTGKVLFFIDGKEASEEELKNIPANEVRGVSRIDNSGGGETTIRVETERNSDKWVLASGIVMDKEGSLWKESLLLCMELHRLQRLMQLDTLS